MNRQTIVVVIVAIVSGVLGYYANVVANRKNNLLLVQLLKDQLTCINNQITTIPSGTGKSNADEMQYLDNRKAYLEQQLNYYSQKFGIY